MDDSFFKDLDEHITNVGTDKYWKKKIGNIVLWFSPIPYTGQLRANETLAKLSQLKNDESGIDAIQETKRITLSHSIVGFDEYDLRKFRFDGPCILVNDSTLKIELHKYIYQKMAGWDSEFVDVAFDVFADLSETNRKEILKDVTFDNIKDYREELEELETKAANLRDQLDMPQMTEISKINEEEDNEEEDNINKEKSENDFDPFKIIKIDEEVYASDTIPPTSLISNEPDKISPIQKELESRKIKEAQSDTLINGEKDIVSTADNPHGSIPSVPDEIIENQANKKTVNFPRIDPLVQSINSRFQPPQR